MNLSPVELWNSLQGLPWLFSLFVFLLTVFLVLALYALPAYFLVVSESTALSSWMRNHYQNLVSQAQQQGAGNGQTLLGLLSFSLDLICVAIGRLVAWLAVFMVIMQFVVVIMRYVFSFGSIQMQESIWYMHGILFMLGAAYALFQNEHVRVDIFYNGMPPRKKALVDLMGSIVFLIPLCITIWWFAWGYVSNSWAVMETSTEGGGLPFIYLFKTIILGFAGLMLLQALSLIIRSSRALMGLQPYSLTTVGD